MDSTNPTTELEHTHEHQEHQEPQEQIQQDDNVEEEVELVQNYEPVVPEKLHEVEERAHEEETEKADETVEKVDLEVEEEIKPVPLKEDRKSTSIAAQDQKIILNDVEAEEDQSPTYKDFFDKEKSAKASITKIPEKPESNRGSPSSKRWDQLYERAKTTQEKKDKLRKEFEATRKEDPECTFKPKLFSSTYSEVVGGAGEGDPIHKRTTTWRANKDKKLAEAKDQIKDKDLDGCTFKPDISKTQGSGFLTQNLSSYGTKGVDLHLKRQIVAKQVREEKETILDNPLQKLPSHVYKKEGNITIPNPPEFNKGKPFEINALKKPFEFPVPGNSAGNSISPKKKVESPQKKIQMLVDPVQVNNVRFGHAIQLLHNELHRIKINN